MLVVTSIQAQQPWKTRVKHKHVITGDYGRTCHVRFSKQQVPWAAGIIAKEIIWSSVCRISSTDNLLCRPKGLNGIVL